MKAIKMFLAIFMCIWWTVLAAQTNTPYPAAQGQEQQESTQPPAETNIPVDSLETDDELTGGVFIYKPRGRRDPFWNLLQGKSVKINRESREGIAGLLIEELDLTGILYKSGVFIAMFKGPDGRPYDVKIGDNVYDGEVIKIDYNTVVFKRLLTIALGGTRERIITVRLIPEEEAEKK